MRITTVHQPFDHNGNPSSLGEELRRQLLSGRFTEVIICTAFATSGGTSRLLGGLVSVTQRGGQVHVLVGVSNGVTSKQAIEDCLAGGARVEGFHTGGTVLFHPKTYLLVGPNDAWLSIGSSNLTGDGLFRNFEANTIIELNPKNAADACVIAEVRAWWDYVRTRFHKNAFQLSTNRLAQLVRSGDLVDERARAPRQARTRAGGRRRRFPPIRVPAIPIPGAGGRLAARQPRRVRPGRARLPGLRGVAAQQVRGSKYFAMTLSAHDCSKPTGTKGTPEISLPNNAVPFFPRMRRTDRQYPDLYFDVNLNSRGGTDVVTYRLWRRPGRTGTGHADLRINPRHDTIDLTHRGGGDIVLFEKIGQPTGPLYEVWIIPQGDPNFAQIRQRCDRHVGRGAAGIKHYGFF